IARPRTTPPVCHLSPDWRHSEVPFWRGTSLLECVISSARYGASPTGTSGMAVLPPTPAARSATPGAQDDIGDMRGAGRRVDARLDRVQLDREFVAEQPAEYVDTDIVRMV